MSHFAAHPNPVPELLPSQAVAIAPAAAVPTLRCILRRTHREIRPQNLYLRQTIPETRSGTFVARDGDVSIAPIPERKAEVVHEGRTDDVAQRQETLVGPVPVLHPVRGRNDRRG